MIGNFPAILKNNRLFLKCNRFICNQVTAGTPRSLDGTFISMVCDYVWIQEQLPKKDCLKEIERHAKKRLTVLDSLMTQHNWRFFYDRLNIKRFFNLTRSKIFIRALKNYGKNAYGHDLDMLIILH